MTVDYAKWTYYNRQHFLRFKRRVEQTNLICQECGGAGGYTEPVLDYGQGPFINCGLCEGTGKLTPFLRGWWLRWKRLQKTAERS